MNKPEQGASGAPTEQGHSIASWDWPVLESPRPVAQSNALGYAPDWYRDDQPPEPESQEQEPEQQPLTLEEIEAIRQAAYEDGFNEGKEAGFAKGLEEGKLEGLQQGHSAGLEQGREEGLAMGRELVEQEIAHWQGLAARLANPLNELDQAVEQQLVSLVMQLARALIRHEAETSPRILLEALKEGLALLPAVEQGVTLMLHPDDIARIEQAFGAEECAKRQWRLQSDPTLSPGDLQLATELSSIDLTLSGRIDQLLRNFLRDNASQKPASPDSRP